MESTKNKLITAIDDGNYQEVKKILHTADTTRLLHQDDYTFKLLENAVTRKYPLITKLLLSKIVKKKISRSHWKQLLHLAIDNKHPETVQILLDSGADVNVKFQARNTPLHLAVTSNARNHLQIVAELLKRGAVVEARNTASETPLHLAAQGFPKAVEYLLKAGSNVNVFNAGKQTPLHIAVKSKCLKSIQLLLNKGAKINVKGPLGQYPLHLAVKENPNILKFLLTKGADTNAKDNQGDTPLHLAVEKGCLRSVELLLDKGANVNASSKLNKRPIHIAAEGKNKYPIYLLPAAAKIIAVEAQMEILKYLIEKGADVNVQDNKQQTPLHIAVKHRCLESVRLIVNCKSYDPARDTKIIEIAAMSNHEIMRLILSSNAKIATKDKIYRIATVSSLAIGELLLQHGADINANIKYPNDSGYCIPLLHHATMEGRVHTAARLLDAGADINKTAKVWDHWVTPLYLALQVSPGQPYQIKSRIMRIVKMLLELGADVNNLPLRSNGIIAIEPFFTISTCENFINHIVRMKYRQLEVDDRLITYMINTPKRFFAGYYERSEKEILSMKTEKFNNTHVTFFDLVTKSIDQLVTYARNENVVKGLEEKRKYEAEFPMYGKVATEQLEMGIKRLNLLNKTFKYCRYLFPTLPPSCTDKILSYLEDEDIEIMSRVFKFRKNLIHRKYLMDFKDD